MQRIDLLGFAVLVVGLAGCAAVTTSNRPVSPASAPTPDEAVALLQHWLVGDWANVPDAGATAPALRAAVSAEDGVLTLRLPDPGQTLRRYRMVAQARTADVLLQRLDAHARTQPGCQMLLEYRMDPPRFEGSTAPGTCHESGAGGVSLVNTHLRVQPDQLHLDEALVFAGSASDMASFSLALVKVREFEGWVALHHAGPAATAPQDNEFQVLRPLRLQEGGEMRVLGAPGGRQYGLQLTRRNYPGAVGQVLRLALHSLPDGAVLAYAWADPGARRIGFSLGWFQCGFDQRASP